MGRVRDMSYDLLRRITAEAWYPNEATANGSPANWTHRIVWIYDAVGGLQQVCQEDKIGVNVFLKSDISYTHDALDRVTMTEDASYSTARLPVSYGTNYTDGPDYTVDELIWEAARSRVAYQFDRRDRLQNVIQTVHPSAATNGWNWRPSPKALTFTVDKLDRPRNIWRHNTGTAVTSASSLVTTLQLHDQAGRVSQITQSQKVSGSHVSIMSRGA